MNVGSDDVNEDDARLICWCVTDCVHTLHPHYDIPQKIILHYVLPTSVESVNVCPAVVF